VQEVVVKPQGAV